MFHSLTTASHHLPYPYYSQEQSMVVPTQQDLYDIEF